MASNQKQGLRLGNTAPDFKVSYINQKRFSGMDRKWRWKIREELPALLW